MNTSRVPIARVHDREQVESLFTIRRNHKDVQDRLLTLLSSSGAILKGHFLLESNQHSDMFFRFSDIAVRLSDVDFIADLLFADLERDHIISDAVLVQQSGGRVLAEMLNQKLDKQMIVARVNERNQPTGELVNNIDLHTNDKVLIIEDLVTTGSSMKKMIEIVLSRRARPVALIAFATRNKEKMAEFEKTQDIPLYVLGDLAFANKTIAKSGCELCLASEPIPSWEI